jgi:CRP/FNR family transcriptional regulator, cyclic AMP receptor protein
VINKWLYRFFRDANHAEELLFFRSVPLFQGLSKRELGIVLLAAQPRQYQVGEQLFVEGEPGKAIFIIRSGKVELTRRTNKGQRTLGLLGPGQMFGEMALLDNVKRTASAVIKEEGTILLLYLATLNELIERNPRMGVQLLRNISIMLSTLLRRANQDLDEQHRESV